MKIARKIFVTSALVVLLAAGCDNNQAALPDQAQDMQNAPTADQAQLQRVQIQASEKVEGDFADELFNFYADENKTALDLLKSAHKVVTKTFSGVGEFVESINGVKPDSKHFWAFYVNDKSSNVGAGAYIPNEGDKLEWKMEEIK